MSSPLLIVLSPPRSFSSVVGSMLGQHPQTYGFPELNLFVADTVADLLRGWERAGPQARHGLLRSVAQCLAQEQTEASIDAAQAWLEEREHWSTRAVWTWLLEHVSPAMGVDKSPRTAMKSDYLERSLRLFPDACYLHLTRHPRTTAESQLAITSRNQGKDWGGGLDSSRIRPERWWIRAQQNIERFASNLYEGQYMRIKGEELLSDPELYLTQIAEWLDLDSGPEAIDAMLHPENSTYACIGPENARYGQDLNFLESPVLRRGTVREGNLDDPLGWAEGEHFSAEIVRTARELGYR